MIVVMIMVMNMVDSRHLHRMVHGGGDYYDDGMGTGNDFGNDDHMIIMMTVMMMMMVTVIVMMMVGMPVMMKVVWITRWRW